MIYDYKENIMQYAAISKGIEIAAKEILEKDLDALPVGTYQLEGGVYYMIQQPRLKSYSEAKWEHHADYLDIQMGLGKCTEVLGYAPVQNFTAWEHPEGQDNWFSEEDPQWLPLPLKPGYFSILFPQDAHAPAMGNPEDDHKKVVFKIPV